MIVTSQRLTEIESMTFSNEIFAYIAIHLPKYDQYVFIYLISFLFHSQIRADHVLMDRVELEIVIECWGLFVKKVLFPMHNDADSECPPPQSTQIDWTIIPHFVF